MTSEPSQRNPAEIERQILSYRPRVVDLDPNDTLCRLIRLTSDDYIRLRRSSIPIKEDAGFYFALMYRLRRQDGELSLAQIYTVLTDLFGDSSNLYDDYKGSFAFPLFLHLQKQAQSYPYLLRIKDHKGSIEFNLYRIFDPNDRRYDRNVYHEPFEDEFGREEINYFTSYLYGFLKGYFNAVGGREVRFFFRKVPAIWAVYGWKDGHFFEEQYDSEDAYRAAIHELEQHADQQPHL